MKEFNIMGLKPELLEALKRINFVSMTEVQEISIPTVLEHKDVIVRSKTGSGKTGAFLIPIIQMLEAKGHPQALIVVPTRELAVQVSLVAEKLVHGSRLRSTVVYGGASINVQMQQLHRGVDIVIGTPGRILDLVDRNSLVLSRVKFMVLDEADLMLDMGFIEDIEQILSMTPKDRETLLFSATMPPEVHEIAKRYMKPNTVKITIGKEEDLTVSTIKHNYFMANGRQKFAALLAYIDVFNPQKCIIFTATQRESELIHKFLEENNFSAVVMHGGLTQAKREHSLQLFKTQSNYLISTNLASRGLDIQNITDIINFDAPDDPKIYVHRVGRSARMGKDGRAFTLFGHEQRGLMKATSDIANVTMNHLDLDTVKYENIKLPEMHRGRGRDRGPMRGGDRRGGPSGRRFGGDSRSRGGRITSHPSHDRSQHRRGGSRNSYYYGGQNSN